MTNALCVGSEKERSAWKHVVDLAVARNCPLIPVVLAAEIDENVRRLESVERSSRKLKDGVAFRRIVERDAIQRPDIPELIELNVTYLSTERAAEALHTLILRIADRGLAKATTAHLRFKQAIGSG